MKDLTKYINSMIRSLDKDAEKGIANVLAIDSVYIACINKIWKRPEAAELILEHTNAVYIRKDTRPKKGEFKDKPYILCDICVDDSMVRSELDTHRELLALQMMEAGLSFNEMRILPARRGMLKRHPFSKKPGSNANS